MPAGSRLPATPPESRRYRFCPAPVAGLQRVPGQRASLLASLGHCAPGTPREPCRLVAPRQVQSATWRSASWAPVRSPHPWRATRSAYRTGTVGCSKCSSPAPAPAPAPARVAADSSQSGTAALASPHAPPLSTPPRLRYLYRCRGWAVAPPPRRSSAARRIGHAPPSYTECTTPPPRLRRRQAGRQAQQRQRQQQQQDGHRPLSHC